MMVIELLLKQLFKLMKNFQSSRKRLKLCRIQLLLSAVKKRAIMTMEISLSCMKNSSSWGHMLLKLKVQSFYWVGLHKGYTRFSH